VTGVAAAIGNLPSSAAEHPIAVTIGRMFQMHKMKGDPKCITSAL
jgi:hypothetical protein